MKLIEINKKEFTDFVIDQDTNNFYQTKQWAEVKRHDNWHTYFVGLDNNGKIEAAAILFSKELPIFRRRIFYCPGGLIINYKDLDLLRLFTKYIKDFVEEKKGLFLKIEPFVSLKSLDNDGNYIQGGYNNENAIDTLRSLGYLEVETNTPFPNNIYEIKLNKDMLSQFNNSTRDTIITNEKKAIYTKIIDDNEIDKVINLITQSNNKVDFINIDYKDLYNIFKQNNMIDVRFVYMDIDKYIEIAKGQDNKNEAYDLKYKYGHNILLGCAISICYNQTVSTITTAINDKFNDLLPIYNLHYDIMKWAYDNNYEYYNIYGIDDKNFYDYCKNYNGNVKKLIGEYDLVISPLRYKLYNKFIKGRLR